MRPSIKLLAITIILGYTSYFLFALILKRWSRIDHAIYIEGSIRLSNTQSRCMLSGFLKRAKDIEKFVRESEWLESVQREEEQKFLAEQKKMLLAGMR